MIWSFQLFAKLEAARAETVALCIRPSLSRSIEATTWPFSPRAAMSGGTEKGSITSPRSWDADHAIQPTPMAIPRPTTAVMICRTAFIRSLKRRQRRCDRVNIRCSCRCSVCSWISRVW